MEKVHDILGTQVTITSSLLYEIGGQVYKGQEIRVLRVCFLFVAVFSLGRREKPLFISYDKRDRTSQILFGKEIVERDDHAPIADGSRIDLRREWQGHYVISILRPR